MSSWSILNCLKRWPKRPTHTAVSCSTTVRVGWFHNAGNILNYLVSLADLTEVFETHGRDLTKIYHIAVKKIPYYSKGVIVRPKENNGYKFELFVNGFIPFLTKPVSFYQVVREEEFAPVKNEKGNPQDSPDTARQLMSALHKKWLIQAGATVQGDGLCEIDELLSYEGENLAQFTGRVIVTPQYLKP